MFYDELEPDNETPMSETLGAPILEEEEGGGTRDLRNLLERKRQKREPYSSRYWECIVVWEPRERPIYGLWRHTGPECTTQEGPRPLDCIMAQEEIPGEPVKEAQIQPEEELREINLGAKLESHKPIFISSQLAA